MIKKLNFIRPVVSVIIISVVLILLFCNGLVVHAAENNTFYSIYNYPVDIGVSLNDDDWILSSLYNSNYQVTFNQTAVDYSLYLDGDISNGEFTLPDGFNYSEYPYFYITNYYSNGMLCVILLKENTFLVSGATTEIVTLGSDLNDFSVTYVRYNMTSSGPVFYDINSYSTKSYSKTNVTYPYIGVSFGRIIDIYYSNSIVYGSKGIGNVSSQNVAEYFSAWVNDFDNYQESYPQYGFIDTNYNLYDIGYVNPFNGETIGGGGSGSVYPDGSGGTVSNNLYLKNCNFNFNGFESFKDETGIALYNFVEPFDGNINFIATLNDWQRNNSDQLELVFKFDIYMKLATYVNAPTDDTLWDYGYFKGDDIVVPLSDFVSSNSYNFNPYNTLKDNIYSVNNLDITYYDAWQNLKSKYGFNIDNSTWYLDCSVYLRSVVSGATSGSLSERYNYILGTKSINSNTIHNNDNPFVNPDTGVPDDSGNTDTSQNISSGGNTLINNDNDSIIINGNGEVAEDIVNNLIPSDGVGGLSDQLQEHLDSNGWLSVLKSTFPMFGVEFWDMVGTYFLIALGVCVTGFVLRIILDLL